jgi:hypothetical protein
MDRTGAQGLLDSILNREPVRGLTHDFYRYPARFSPQFARRAIEVFTKPGDVVLDPFMGGGTTLVEARALGRLGIGVDINTLSTFLVQAKTTIVSNADVAELRLWGTNLSASLNVRNPAKRSQEWTPQNLTDRSTWPIRKLLELALAAVASLEGPTRQRLARCVLLKAAQWALDCRSTTPTASQFRRQIVDSMDDILAGALAFRGAVLRADRKQAGSRLPRTLLLNRSVEGIENDSQLDRYRSPRLILTSPPYPGVHVLYHRWQIQGRRETPAPFWIAGSLDGQGASYYTFGDRKESGLSRYFHRAENSFKSLARISTRHTLLVQMVAFSKPSWQLPKYLQMLRYAGFDEITYPALANAKDGRVWRGVPNRKWYARNRGDSAASREVVLFHRLQSR